MKLKKIINNLEFNIKYISKKNTVSYFIYDNSKNKIIDDCISYDIKPKYPLSLELDDYIKNYNNKSN